MNSINKNLISNKFRYTKKNHIKLNKKQLFTRDRIQDKIDKGIYGLEEVSCICGEEDDIIISETDRYGLRLSVVICKGCGILRMNPRLNKDSLINFYNQEYRDLYMEHEEVEKCYFKNMVSTGKEILGLIERHCPYIKFKGLEVLEIGCSAGGILVPFLQRGANVKGYDYDQRYLDYGNKFNPALSLCFGGIENLGNETKKYDLILINHVLEHLPEPQSAIDLIRNSLRKNGIVYIGVPGLKNPRYYYSPTRSFLGSLHIGHLSHFTNLSLIRLMRQFTVAFIDDEIRAIFKFDRNNSNISFVSEYLPNLEFIKKYENGFIWKIKRLKFIIQDFPFLIRSILPFAFIRPIKFIYKKISRPTGNLT